MSFSKPLLHVPLDSDTVGRGVVLELVSDQ